MKKIFPLIITLTLLFSLSLSVRLYKLNSPLGDWHSYREADTAAVARNFIKEGFNILYPQSDSLVALNEHNLPNPNRYFINEFPFYNALVALLYQHFGIHEYLGRLVSAIFASLGTVFLFLFTKKLFNFKTALLAATYYAILPYNVYYGRVFMPDPTFVSLSIGSLYFLDLYISNPNIFIGFLFAFVFALAMLVKPYAIFLLLPITYWLLVHKKFKGTIFVALALVPLLLWRLHVNNHPEGAFASTWLLNGDNIRFKGAFFRWLIYDRLNRLIFATGGFVLLVIGFLRSHLNKNSLFIFFWFISILIYMTVFAKGNVTHDYYQLPIMPPGAILVAIGFFSLPKIATNPFGKVFNVGLGICLLIISLAFGWFEVRDFYNINNPSMIIAGQRVDKLTPQNSLVIAPYQGDPAFLYQTNRHGWTIGGDISSMIKQGATTYVTTSYDAEAHTLEEKYTTLEKTKDYLILDLTKPK